jgi:hypothetical protein
MSYFNCGVCYNDMNENSIVQCCNKMLCIACFEKITEGEEAEEEPTCPFCRNEDVFLEGLETEEFDEKDRYIIELEKKMKQMQVEKKPKKTKETKEKNSIEKTVIKTKDRSFKGYVMKYIPDKTELVYSIPKTNHKVKCVVDYASKSFVDDEGEKHGTLNMVYTKFVKKNNLDMKGRSCWTCFKWGDKKIDNLYEDEDEDEE